MKFVLFPSSPVKGEGFAWTLSFGCGVTSVSAKELLAQEEFL